MRVKIYLRTLFLPALFCFALVNPANAGCDPCIQSAAQAASGQMQSSLSAITSTVNGNVQATNALNQTVIAANNAIQQTIVTNTNLIKQGMSASTNRIELAIQQNSKTMEAMNDHLVQSLVQVMKEISVAEQVQKNKKMFDTEIAQPLSGDIGANRAPLLKAGVVQSEQLHQGMVDGMYEWSSETGDTPGAKSNLKATMLLKEDEAMWDPSPMLNSSVITAEESVNLQKLLTVLVNPVPLKKLTKAEASRSPKSAEYELKRNLYNTQLTIAHSVLAKSVSERMATIPISQEDWGIGYTTAEANDEGKTSVMAMLESETLGRLTSEGWYKDIKTKTDAGVLREQVYQQAINNKLLLKILEQEEQKLLLQALSFAQKLNNQKPQEP